MIGEPDKPLMQTAAANYLLDAGIVDGFVLSNDQIVVVTMQLTHLDSERRRWLQATRQHCMDTLAEDFDLSRDLGPRFAVHWSPPGGELQLWDIVPPAAAIID